MISDKAIEQLQAGGEVTLLVPAHAGELRIFRSTQQSSGEPGYPERSGETVTILRPLTADEADAEVGPMFRIRFSDGIETSAFDDELHPVADPRD